MACRSLRSSLSILIIITFAFVFLGGVFSGDFLGRAFAQESDGKTSSSSSSQSRGGDRPYLRDRLEWNWNQRGRSVPPGKSAAGLRFRAYQQKMAMRARRATYPPKQSLGGAPATPPPASSSHPGSTLWAPLRPAPLASQPTC